VQFFPQLIAIFLPKFQDLQGRIFQSLENFTNNCLKVAALTICYSMFEDYAEK